MRISPETGLIGGWSKQTRLVGVAEGELGYLGTKRFSTFVLFLSYPDTVTFQRPGKWILFLFNTL